MNKKQYTAAIRKFEALEDVMKKVQAARNAAVGHQAEHSLNDSDMAPINDLGAVLAQLHHISSGLQDEIVKYEGQEELAVGVMYSRYSKIPKYGHLEEDK